MPDIGLEIQVPPPPAETPVPTPNIGATPLRGEPTAVTGTSVEPNPPGQEGNATPLPDNVVSIGNAHSAQETAARPDVNRLFNLMNIPLPEKLPTELQAQLDQLMSSDPTMDQQHYVSKLQEFTRAIRSSPEVKLNDAQSTNLEEFATQIGKISPNQAIDFLSNQIGTSQDIKPEDKTEMLAEMGNIRADMGKPADDKSTAWQKRAAEFKGTKAYKFSRNMMILMPLLVILQIYRAAQFAETPRAA